MSRVIWPVLICAVIIGALYLMLGRELDSERSERIALEAMLLNAYITIDEMSIFVGAPPRMVEMWHKDFTLSDSLLAVPPKDTIYLWEVSLRAIDEFDRPIPNAQISIRNKIKRYRQMVGITDRNGIALASITRTDIFLVSTSKLGYVFDEYVIVQDTTDIVGRKIGIVPPKDWQLDLDTTIIYDSSEVTE